jgi:hypothetical protein
MSHDAAGETKQGRALRGGADHGVSRRGAEYRRRCAGSRRGPTTTTVTARALFMADRWRALEALESKDGLGVDPLSDERTGAVGDSGMSGLDAVRQPPRTRAGAHRAPQHLASTGDAPTAGPVGWRFFIVNTGASPTPALKPSSRRGPHEHCLEVPSILLACCSAARPRPPNRSRRQLDRPGPSAGSPFRRRRLRVAALLTTEVGPRSAAAQATRVELGAGPAACARVQNVAPNPHRPLDRGEAHAEIAPCRSHCSRWRWAAAPRPAAGDRAEVVRRRWASWRSPQ